MTIFDQNLDPNPANYVPLSPVSFLARAARGLSARDEIGGHRLARHPLDLGWCAVAFLADRHRDGVQSLLLGQ